MNSEEIAKLAGVSRSTVSRVINGYSNVPPETKERVEQVIREYGYVPNTSARNLAGKPSNVIGLFFVEYGELKENIIHSSPFYSEFLANAIDRLKKLDCQLVVSIINKTADFDMVETAFINKTMAGCILMGDIVPNPVLEKLGQIECPTMLVNQRSSIDYPNIYLMNTENYKGAYQAVQLLVRYGHKKIAHITGSVEKSSIKERFEGYRDCLLHNQLPFNESYIYYSHIHRAESGYQAVLKMMADNKGDEPTAIFAANDLLAFGAMKGLKELGLKIPKDISIIGYDNAELSQYMSPPLTTVQVSIEKIARMTVDSLLMVIRKREEIPVYSQLREFQIIERGSVAEVR
ncbi:LacI family DNA-binding transcriptional regulator [Lacrimispora sp.]|uniref:LacI family DNA-binding transcriptional regulator n=1 Tax=Lacrimispora sp. TaxID=2719234 RepID=UPI0034601BFB